MMKSFFKKLAFVMALAMVVTLAAPAATNAVAAESNLKIAYQNGATISEVNIAKGAQEDLRFLGAKTYKEINWISSDNAVATVDKAGVVTAVADGTATITVLVDGSVASVKVNVGTSMAKYGVDIYEQKGNVAVTEATLEVGAKADYRFIGVKDYSVERYFCTWASDDTAVATVDQSGVVTAVSAGTAKITLIIFNKVTGVAYTANALTVTVGTAKVEEEVPAFTATQTTHIKFDVALDKAEAFDKADLHLYRLNDTNEGDACTVWDGKPVSSALIQTVIPNIMTAKKN